MRAKTAAAFTLLELVVVIGVLSIVAATILPSLSHGESRSPAFECLNHHRQLCDAWRMYADENSEKLVLNVQGGEARGGAGDPTFGVGWVQGWLDWTTATTDNTNVAFLINPKYARLAPYVNGATNLFKCPADRFIAPVQANRGWQRVRSVSVNILLGQSNAEQGPLDPSYKHLLKLSEFLYPVPAEAHVFLDEHPDSINDPGFFPPHQTMWVDVPAVQHHGGAAFGFADSHAEIHRWRGSLTNIKGSYGSIDGSYLNNSLTAPAGDPDIHWMSYHTSRPGTNSY